MNAFVPILRSYITALGNSDYAAIKGLFAPGGVVRSPFLGELAAGPFFDRLAAASDRNVITPIEIFVSANNKASATAYFQYDWTVKDGTLISFKVMDLFKFDPATATVLSLDLIYDTHSIRSTSGNKYES